MSQEDTATLRTELARRPLLSNEKELNARQQTYRALAQRAHGRGATVRQEWSDILLGAVDVDFDRQCGKSDEMIPVDADQRSLEA